MPTLKIPTTVYVLDILQLEFFSPTCVYDGCGQKSYYWLAEIHGIKERVLANLLNIVSLRYHRLFRMCVLVCCNYLLHVGRMQFPFSSIFCYTCVAIL